MKQVLRQLIAQGKTQQAIEKLLRITEVLGDVELHEEVIMQSARYETFQKEHHRGIVSTEEKNISIATINSAILHIVSRLPDNIQSDTDHSSLRRFILKNWPLLMGLPLLVVLGIVIKKQSSTAVVSKETHSLTVFVHGKRGKNDLLLKNRGKVEITYGTKKARESINDKGQAIFNEIPAYFFTEDARVFINIRETEEEPYQALFPDSLYQLSPHEPVYLPIILQHLDRIFGQVIWEEAPLENVIVSTEGARDTTDVLGEYELLIPDTLQQQKKEVRFFKPGYKLLIKPAFPQTAEPLNVVMLK